MNDLQASENRSGALAAPDKNFFEQYSDAAQQNRIVGDLLKFSKGEYLAGQDGEEVDEGTELVANMHELMVGWIKWDDSKPVDMQMGRVVEGYQPARRADLGDNDQEDWETDEASGRPRDPWQLTNYLILKEPGGEKLYTFTTSSKGGLGAVAKLAGEYGKRVRQKPDEFPIVALNVDSYRHPNKAYGKIFVPKLDVVGWLDKREFDGVLDDGGSASEPDEPPFDEPTAAAAAAKKGGGKAKGGAAASETAF